MAKLIGDFVVTDVYVSKTGACYLSLVDTDNGGTIKMKLDGVPEVKNGMQIHLDAVVRGRLYNGSLNLDMENGTMTKK